MFQPTNSVEKSQQRIFVSYGLVKIGIRSTFIIGGTTFSAHRLTTARMGEIYSDFLDELLLNIRARPISWDAQQRSGVINESEVRTVKTIDKQRRDKRIDTVTKVLLSEEWLILIAGCKEVCSAHVEFTQEGEKSGYITIHVGHVG